jgi:DNA modification methylase
VSNAFSAAGGNKEIHMNEKPVAMLQHFMRMFVDEYSLVLDPTAGSGNALKAAQALRANHVLGLERDQEFFNRATEVYYADL